MILFYKQSPEEYISENLVIDSSFPGEVSFGDAILGRQEVIVTDSIEGALEVASLSPKSRVVLVANDIYAFTPNDILELAKNGISKMVNRGDVIELSKSIYEAYNEKKVSSFVAHEEEMTIFPLDSKMQLNGMVNNHIIGVSDEVKKVLVKIKRFSEYKNDILVMGEKGSGKEVFVNTVLDNIAETKNGLSRMSLGEVNKELFASDLFGHVKGSFTGAVSDKVGMLAACKDGVLYLDEIGELPLASQAMLLRLIENREFRPVGSNKVEYFKGRIIMATNRPLKDMVEAGEFKGDLYDRVAAMLIRLPPLRSRTEDIPLLVNHFLSQLNEEHPHIAKAMSSDAMSLLSGLEWQGNVRELKLFVLRLHVEEPTAAITATTVRQVILNDEVPRIQEALSNYKMLQSLTEESKENTNVQKSHGKMTERTAHHFSIR